MTADTFRWLIILVICLAGVYLCHRLSHLRS